MPLKLRSTVAYKPKFGDCTFHLKVIGATKYREYWLKMSEYTKGQTGDEPNAQLSDDARKLRRDTVVEHIDKIQGYFIDDVEIKTGAEFYDHPHVINAHVIEIENAVIDASMTDEEKAEREKLLKKLRAAAAEEAGIVLDDDDPKDDPGDDTKN